MFNNVTVKYCLQLQVRKKRTESFIKCCQLDYFLFSLSLTGNRSFDSQPGTPKTTLPNKDPTSPATTSQR